MFNSFGSQIQSGRGDEKLLSYTSEMKLTMDATDIVEELKMITYLMEKQMDTVESSRRELEEAAAYYRSSYHADTVQFLAHKLVKTAKSEIEAISRDMQHTQDMVYDMKRIQES
jgi:hypothetical protein